MTRFAVALRTQPADPRRGDILYIDGHFVDDDDHATQRELVSRLSDLALNGVTKKSGVQVSRQGHAAMTQLPATEIGVANFLPAITIALVRTDRGLEMNGNDIFAHVRHFAASNNYRVVEEDARERIDALMGATTRQGFLHGWLSRSFG